MDNDEHLDRFSVGLLIIPAIIAIPFILPFYLLGWLMIAVFEWYEGDDDSTDWVTVRYRLNDGTDTMEVVAPPCLDVHDVLRLPSTPQINPRRVASVSATNRYKGYWTLRIKYKEKSCSSSSAVQVEPEATSQRPSSIDQL